MISAMPQYIRREVLGDDTLTAVKRHAFCRFIFGENATL